MNKLPKKERSIDLVPKDYVDRELEREKVRTKLAMQKQALSFIQWIYGWLLFATFLVIFLQGFKVWGFQLDPSFLQWLGAATVGEVASLAILIYKALFGIKNE